MNFFKRALRYLKNNGIRKSCIRLIEKIQEFFINKKRNKIEQENYLKWIKNNEPNEEEIGIQKNTNFEYEPVISVIVPMYKTPECYFRELIKSLKEQTYKNWELCLADGSEKKENFIDDIIKNDDRIKYKFLGVNKGISGNSNEAIKMATGDYYALLDHDDIIPVFSLYEIVKKINEDKEAEFFYTDEDKILDKKNIRIGPHFKPDFAPDTLRSYNYICHFSIFKKSLMEKLKGFDSKFDGSQDYDLILRATETANRIVHIPKILYHWRINENSVASSASAKPYAYVAAKKAILASLKRQNIEAVVEDSKILGLYRVRYSVKNKPLISIIILNREHKNDLKKCIKSILNSTYDNYEILILENNSKSKKIFKYYEKLKNNSKIKIIYCPNEKFNYSKLNNFAVKKARGEYLIFLNNDIKIITNDWMENLLGCAMRKDVGVVGGKLLYSDNTIQHAGIVINFTGVAGHVNAHMKRNDVGYMGRLMIQQNFTAITGALMMINKKTFNTIGGFDEKLPLAYNDVDLCLKLRNIGKVNVYDPYIVAYHYESKTRGYDDTEKKRKRLENEAKYLMNKWPTFFEKEDIYFNINFRHDVPDMRVNPNKIEEKNNI